MNCWLGHRAVLTQAIVLLYSHFPGEIWDSILKWTRSRNIIIPLSHLALTELPMNHQNHCVLECCRNYGNFETGSHGGEDVAVGLVNNNAE
jgi:hypothetical protein